MSRIPASARRVATDGPAGRTAIASSRPPVAGANAAKARPLGVLILAILNFLVAAVAVGMAAAMFTHGAVLRFPAVQRVLAAIGGGVWGFLGTSILLALIMGVGLWRMKDWGRLLMVIFSIFGLITGAAMLLAQLTHFVPALVFLRAATVVIYLVILRYLLRPEIKAAFTP